MRIRRKDRETSEEKAEGTHQRGPFDQELVSPQKDGPTSTDPVKSLTPGVPAAPLLTATETPAEFPHPPSWTTPRRQGPLAAAAHEVPVEPAAVRPVRARPPDAAPAPRC